MTSLHLSITHGDLATVYVDASRAWGHTPNHNG